MSWNCCSCGLCGRSVSLAVLQILASKLTKVCSRRFSEVSINRKITIEVVIHLRYEQVDVETCR